VQGKIERKREATVCNQNELKNEREASGYRNEVEKRANEREKEKKREKEIETEREEERGRERRQ